MGLKFRFHAERMHFCLIFLVGISFAFATSKIDTPVPNISKCHSLSDRDILVALYQSTGGPQWKLSQNWLSTQSIDNWYGVVTGKNGAIKGLHLKANNLRG